MNRGGPLHNHLSITVYYSDTDCGGVVYYANYLKYMEHGRMEFFRSLGLDLPALHNNGTLFVVAETTIKYRASARLGDTLDVETSMIGKTSITINFKTYIANQNSTLLVVAETKMACVNQSGKIKRIPDDMIRILENR